MMRMMPCCCSSVPCADVWREKRTGQSGLRMMDITHLQEKYNSIREQQRRHTRVLCFNTAQNSEEVNGEHLVVVIPVCQVKHSAGVFSVDRAGGPWHTHLDAHRLTHTADRSHVSAEVSSSSSESERLSEDSDHLKDGRKTSAPAGLSRQMSFGSSRSSPSGSRYYPFPQRKGLRKSEAARRLGLYASL